jgi:glycine cleavage system H protein
MTAALVLLTLSTLILINYVQTREKVAVVARRASASSGVSERPPEYLPSVRPLGNVRYHPGHTWALRESPTLVRVGIDDLAADLIGRVEGILLPKRGVWIRQGQKMVTVLKDGSKIELVSPIEGEVTDVNEAVLSDTSLLASDPYGDGWLLTVISPEAETNFRNLLSGSLAQQWMADAESRLRAKLQAVSGVVVRDDGLVASDTSLYANRQSWNELTYEFFLTRSGLERGVTRESLRRPMGREEKVRSAVA